MSFIFAPTILVTAIDDDVDVSMVFNMVEEETKETKEKSTTYVDDLFHSAFVLPSCEFETYKSTRAFYNSVLAHLYCPGEVAPPPELV
ncbi:MAG TPA: hypothetical protein VK014_01225 [Cyclobacteriaceae bacterium]|nr:hypothetical protein [Cyclobacteriaceae bacterium]